MPFDQAEFDLRCEWGQHGLLNLAPVSDAVVIVDILSFSTAVDIAVANGASVFPFRWNDDSAAQFAEANGAALALKRGSPEAWSLSPASLESIPAGASLVLPSPNGSTLCLSTNNVPTFTACFRNAAAVAEHLSRFAARISLIPAGERWQDDALRPCLEDWVGAGAVLSMLTGTRSPEADMAIAAFQRFRGDLNATLSRCASGKELIQRGFQRDVDLAAAFGASAAAPLLQRDRFVDARRFRPDAV